MKENNKIELLEKKIDSLTNVVKTVACRAYANDLLTRYKLKGYVNKKDDSRDILEDPEKTGWYVEAGETRIDIYEDWLLKRRIGSDYECVYSYWPNGEMYTEVWKDLTTGLISECRVYTENGELAESTQSKRDSSGDIVHEYVQTFWHTEDKVDEEHGRLLKITEFWNDLIDKSKSSYREVVTSEKKGELLYERVDTEDDNVGVWYGEHEKLGTVVNRVENIDFVIHLVYGEDGIVALNVTDERLVSNQQKLIYLKETCQVRELMKDWKKVIEYVEKEKYKKVALKRHWYDFGNKKFVEKIEEMSKRSVMLNIVDLEKVEFVKGTIV